MNIDRLYKDFYGWGTTGYIWLAIAILSIGIISITQDGTILGIVSALSNILCVILVARGKISSYVWGLIGVISYGYLAYTWQLYGDAYLNILLYLPMQFIGLLIWQKRMLAQGNDIEVVEFKSMNSTQWTYLLIATILGYILTFILLYIFSGRVPFIDSATTVLSIVAMILLMLRYKAQWDFWITVNVLSIIMWSMVYFTSSSGESLTTLGMWIIFLGNSVYGKYLWSKDQADIIK